MGPPWDTGITFPLPKIMSTHVRDREKRGKGSPGGHKSGTSPALRQRGGYKEKGVRRSNSGEKCFRMGCQRSIVVRKGRVKTKKYGHLQKKGQPTTREGNPQRKGREKQGGLRGGGNKKSKKERGGKKVHQIGKKKKRGQEETIRGWKLGAGSKK